MYVYRHHKEFAIAADIPAGSTSVVVAGDVSSEPELQPNRRIFIMSQAEPSTWEGKVISSISYDSGSDLTTIVCTTAFVNSFSASDAKLYSSRYVNYEVGRLEGDGTTNTFTVDSQPSEVRLYTSSSPWGVKLEENCPPGSGQWCYDSGTGTVELGFTPATGEIVVAFAGETHVFEDKFLAINAVEEIEEYVYLEPSLTYDCIYIGPAEIMSADVTSDWIAIGREVSPDVWEWYKYHVVCGIATGNFYRFKVKANADSAEVHNYYNVILKCGYLSAPSE